MDPSSTANVAMLSVPSLPVSSPDRESNSRGISTPVASPVPSSAVENGDQVSSRRKPTTPGGRRTGQRHVQQLAPPPPNNCIVLKNLDYNISQAELEEVVRRVAGGRKEFVNLALIEDKTTGNFRGMAFVNFHSVEDATSAMMALGKMSINGRKVVAEYRRLRPGERERKEMNERRHKKYDQNQTRTTFENDVGTEFDASGNAVDKRLIFFQKRETVRKADDMKRVAEKEVREREREAEFRARLINYRDAEVLEGMEIEDISFESDLTSYERRIVHVLCDELNLGHISHMNDEGLRVLTVTKHPLRKEEWALVSAQIKAAADERKNIEADEKRKKKEARREAQRALNAASADKNGASERISMDGRASPQWKKGETTVGGPVTKDELDGIKWFKPRSAKVADGEEVNASNAIRAPQYKLYTPPRQPTGPDGTIGFHKRKSAESETGDTGDDTGNGARRVANSGNGASSTSAENGANNVSNAVKSGDSALKPSGSQTLLNPSVPAFTPSAAYAT